LEKREVVVVGGGPAGLAAALWLGRYRRSTVVFDSGDYRNRWVEESHGYLGMDGISPEGLRRRALKDLERYATVELREECVVGAERSGEGFALSTEEISVECRRIVIATGVRDCFPEIANIFDFYGRSVFVCPSCDGYESEEKDVVVFGWTPETVSFARHLLEWAKTVTIVTDGASFEGDEPRDMRVTVLEKDAVELAGEDGTLSAIVFADGSSISAQMAFFAIDQKPATELAVALGCETHDNGCVCVDGDGKTSVEGVYAAGDIVQGPQLIQVAAATGTIAGISAARSL
jgi:thioredoxin reductase